MLIFNLYKEKTNIEEIDILDDNGMKTGEVLSRGEIHKRGLWHRAVLVAIINDKKEILLQQRSEKKEKNAGMWDLSVAGHVSAGQDGISAAVREINEEVSISIGYNVKVRDFRYIFSYRSQVKYSDDFIENQFYDFFILKKKGIDIKKVKIQKSEVQAVKFVNVQELKEMIKQKNIVDRGKAYDELINFLQKIK